MQHGAESKMMFSDSEEEDIKKFSFLLGSSLRNEDEEQFLTLYDAALPANISKEKVNCIKEKARQIAELPDDQYHELVLKAREFSLAPSTKMHHRGGKSQRKSSWSQNSDEDECIPSENSSALSSYSLRSTDRSGNKTIGSDDLGYHSSGKAVPSLGNLSDHDTSDSESRGGFDYYPKAKSIDSKKYKVDCDEANDGDSSPSSYSDTRGGVFFHYYPVVNHYDEAHDVESSQSSQDFNSPRSDISIGKNVTSDLEMTTFREEHIENVQNDFFTDEDSDSDKKLIHQHKYHRPGTFMPRSNKSSEEYTPAFTGKLSFEKSQEALKGRSASSLRGSKCVDDGVLFPSLTSDRYAVMPGWSTGSRHSGKVTIETTSFPKETDSLLDKKKSATGCDGQMKNGTSVNNLLASKNFSTQNKSEKNSVSRGVNVTFDGEKKSRGEKDNGEEKTPDKSCKDTITDENGNPVVSPNFLNRQAYRQMREQPKSSRAVISTSKNQYSYGTTSSSTDVFHHDFHLEPYLPSQIKDLEDNSLYDKRKLNKNKHKKKVKVVHSEDVANYVGDKDIDELVHFIENDGIQKKKFSTSLSNEHSTKTEKSIKKTKEKKLKFSETSDFPTENLEIIENHSKDINIPVALEESKEIAESLDLSMGNSLGKVENAEQSEVHEKSVESVLKNGADKVEKMPLIKNEEIKNPKQRSSKKEPVAHVDEPVKRKLLCDMEKRVKTTKENENCIKKSNTVKCRESGDILINKREMVNNTMHSPEFEFKDTATDSLKNHELKSENKRKEVHLVRDKVQELKTENNIKHNNAKNSRTEKRFMPQISKDVMKTKSSKAEDSDIPKDVSPYYIFTDVDIIPPVEHEFTLVSKKKKHVPVSKKPVATPRELPVVAKPREKHVPPARTVTPPPYNNNLTANNEENKLRDLSPSAFPALRSDSKGRQSGRDGRRNSTGDVPSDACFKVQDDSDIESVKSLPASQAVNGNQCLAPNMPVTYAKIAASPKQKDALQTGSKVIHVFSPPSEGDGKQPTLWKGNTTERRHSIGSSPDDVFISVEQQAIQSSLQKGISQELVLPGVQLCASRPSTDAVVKLDHVKVQRNLSKNNYFNKSPVIENVGDNGSSVNSETIQSKNHVVVSTLASKDCLNALPQRVTSRMSRKERTNWPHSKTQNNSKKLKMQSVIFLDKRVESVPQNFGISFGFDEAAEPQHDENVINVNPNQTSHSSVKSERLTANVNTNKMVNSNSSTSSAPSAISTVNGENVEDRNVSTVMCSNQMLSGNSSIKNINLTKDEISKKQRALPGMNGVVQPNLNDRPKLTYHRSKPAADKAQTSSIVTKKDLSHKELCDSKKVAPSNIGNVGSSSHKETSSTRMPSNGPKKTCKKIEFVPESASNHVRFNITETVGFLQREWDKVTDMKDRDPSRVVVYSEQ